MIKVVNKRIHIPTNFDAYIGRPNVLGNPYSHLDSSKSGIIKVASREEAIAQYEVWLKKQWSDYTHIADAIDDLADKYMASGQMNLVCWCAPAACHGDIIKRYIENIVASLQSPLE